MQIFLALATLVFPTVLFIITVLLLDRYAPDFLNAFDAYMALVTSLFVAVTEGVIAHGSTSHLATFISGCCFAAAILVVLISMADMRSTNAKAARYLRTGTTVKPFGAS